MTRHVKQYFQCDGYNIYCRKLNMSLVKHENTPTHTLFLKKRNAQSRMAPKSAASVQNSLASATLHCLIDDQNALVTNFKKRSKICLLQKVP